MLVILFGIFIILHGLVHLLYMAHAQKKIEMFKNMKWPDSWLLSESVGECRCGTVAASLSLISALGFISAGVLFFSDIDTRRIILLTTGIYSSLVFIAMWNGKLKRLHDQGFIGILINILVLFIVFIFHWPN